MVSGINKKRLDNLARIVLPTLIVILVLKIGLAVVTVTQLRQTIAQIEGQVQATVNAPAANSDLASQWDDIQRSNRTLSRQFLQMRIALWPLDRMADSVAPYPWGKNWAAAVYLLEIGENLTAAVETIDPLIDAGLMGLNESADGSQTQALINRLKTGYGRLDSSDGLAKLAAHNGQISANMGKLERLQIKNRRLSTLADRLNRLLPTAQAGLTGIEALPTAAGFAGEHRVLILLQNADEIRPTGGFITSSIYLVINDGRVQSAETLASNAAAIDHFAERYYTPPPAPFSQYMELRLWLFRDANWSPDFPTSAAKAASLYSYGREVEIDTVVAINQNTLIELLRVTGPLGLKGREEDDVLSAASAEAFFQDLWTEYRRESFSDRKAFIGDLVPQLFSALSGFSADGEQHRQLVQTLMTLERSGDLLIYSADPTLQRWSEATGFDGSLPVATQDFIYPVATNMGYDKSDFMMARSLDYHVSLQKISEPFGVLTLMAENEALATPGICPPQGNRPGDTYLQRATSCNVNYLRLYLPNRSELLRATTFEMPESHPVIKEGNAGKMQAVTDERNHDVYAGVWMTPPQMTTTGRFVYALHPAEIFRLTAVDTLTYRLLIQKQPGVRPQSATVTIDLPAKLSLKSVSPQPTAQAADALVFELTLDRDLEIELTFEVASNQLEQIGVLLADRPLTRVQTEPAPRFVPTRFPLELE